MAHVLSGLGRLVAGACTLGVLTGLMLAFPPSASGEAAVPAGGGGCTCTISGSGNYQCLAPSACSAGLWACQVSCKD